MGNGKFWSRSQILGTRLCVTCWYLGDHPLSSLGLTSLGWVGAMSLVCFSSTESFEMKSHMAADWFKVGGATAPFILHPSSCLHAHAESWVSFRGFSSPRLDDH